MLKCFEIKDLVTKLSNHSVIGTNVLEFFIWPLKTPALQLWDRHTNGFHLSILYTKKSSEIGWYYNFNFLKESNRKEKLLPLNIWCNIIFLYRNIPTFWCYYLITTNGQKPLAIRGASLSNYFPFCLIGRGPSNWPFLRVVRFFLFKISKYHFTQFLFITLTKILPHHKDVTYDIPILNLINLTV